VPIVFDEAKGASGPTPGGGNGGGGSGKALYETNNPQTAAYSKQSFQHLEHGLGRGGGRTREWTKPDEIVYSAMGPVPKLGGIFASGCNLLFADSSARRTRANASEKTIRAMITPGGGEIYDLDE
jgi:hypothetical protein